MVPYRTCRRTGAYRYVLCMNLQRAQVTAKQQPRGTLEQTESSQASRVSANDASTSSALKNKDIVDMGKAGPPS
jgi:hypothetical protein